MEDSQASTHIIDANLANARLATNAVAPGYTLRAGKFLYIQCL